VRRKAVTQRIAFILLGLSTLAIAAPVILILGFIVVKGLPALSIEFLTEAPRDFLRQGGIYPAIIGTLYLVLGTALFSLPLGVATAIYLNEYAQKGAATRLIRLAIVNLAGVPSVVYGLFGLGLFVLALQFGSSILAGSLTLGLLILPVIITTAEEALKTVPDSLRQASLALGATKWQTVTNVVLPQATPGILTGAILGVGRAAGETAPILFTVAAFYLPFLPRSAFDQVMALPYHLFVVSTQIPGISETTQFGTALVLLSIVIGVNLTAVLLRSRLRKQRRT